MKKHWPFSLLSLILCASLFLCTLCGCSDEYKMKESTAEEKETIITLGGHEVPYELFRAFFFTHESALDDSLTWAEKWELVMPEVLSDISRVYAVFSLCEKYGIDPYSEKTDKILKERIKISIEGGDVNDTHVNGYGTYEAYLEALEKQFLTDRAFRLILRYEIAEEQLLSLLTEPEKSSAGYTEQDLQAFYESDACRMIEMYFFDYVRYGFTLESAKTEVAEKLLERLQNSSTKQERENAAMAYFHALPSQTPVSLYAFPAENGSSLLDEAFSLEIGEYSQLVTLHTETGDYIYLLYRTEKQQSDFTKLRKEIEDLYLRDRFYRELTAKEEELQKQVTYSDLYREKENNPIIFESK